MSKAPEPPAHPSIPRRSTRPPKNEAPDEGWKSAGQTQRLLHELRVHQIELEMQNEELRASRAETEGLLKRYTELYDFAPVGYLTLSAEGSMLELNLPAARLLGRERSLLVGRRLRLLISRATQPAFDAWFRDVFLTRDQQTCEVLLQREGLPSLVAQLEARVSSDGQSARAVVQDISSRKALEEELRQAQKLEVIGRLAGGVAHDFNNILAAMSLSLGLLRGEGESSPNGQLALQDMDALAKRASRLTSQLLLFGRRQILQPEGLELNSALTQLLAMVERLLGEQIRCSFEASSQELWVEADRAMLEQAVMNLCLNARDAMPNGGSLTLETSRVELDGASARVNPKSRPGSFVRLRVSDTGTGMEADVLQHVFEPFFTTKGIGEGTGLGLASVYGTVQQHEGWMNVESRLGYGTTFSLYLPLVARPETLPPPLRDAKTRQGKGETILLVEDEAALLAVSRRVLIRLGYRVLPAKDVREALALWEQHASVIDLMLTDMRMPGSTNGLTLAEQLWTSKPSLKVIIMSGYSAEIPMSGAASRLEFTFLPKPFLLETLASTVQRSLGERAQPLVP